MRINHRIEFFAIVAAVAAAPVVSCLADTYTAVPIADAFVASGSATNNLSGDNFGAAGSLTVEAGNLPQGQFQSVMEFDLSGAESFFNSEYGVGAWSVEAVSLVLTASPHGNAMFNPAAAGSFGVSLMQNNSWVEGIGTGGSPTTTGITYNSLVNTYINNSADQALGAFSFAGGTSGTAAYNLGLTSGVLGDLTGRSDISLRLFPNDSTISYLFNSRMASGGPELMITAVPEPGVLELGLMGGSAYSVWHFLKRRREKLA